MDRQTNDDDIRSERVYRLTNRLGQSFVGQTDHATCDSTSNECVI